MTKRDFFTLAYALRNAKPYADDYGLALDSDGYFYACKAWENAVGQIGTELSAAYPNFKTQLFYRAAGYSLRPDGAMYAVDWTHNRIDIAYT